VAAGVIVLRGRSAPPPTPARRSVAANPLIFVQHDGRALRLHWNRDAADVRGAKTGALVILDGARESRIELQPADLRAGLASYWPESRDVTFRLELDGAPAGSMRASAGSATEERRPPAFQAPVKARRRAAAVQRVQAVAAPVSAEDEPKRPSGVGRALGKIPLLRRLRKHRD